MPRQSEFYNDIVLVREVDAATNTNNFANVHLTTKELGGGFKRFDGPLILTIGLLSTKEHYAMIVNRITFEELSPLWNDMASDNIMHI